LLTYFRKRLAVRNKMAWLKYATVKLKKNGVITFSSHTAPAKAKKYVVNIPHKAFNDA
jgi:hypothetical protein